MQKLLYYDGPQTSWNLLKKPWKLKTVMTATSVTLYHCLFYLRWTLWHLSCGFHLSKVEFQFFKILGKDLCTTAYLCWLFLSLSTGKMHANFFLETCVSGINWSTNEEIIWKIKFNMNFHPQNNETNEKSI